MTAKKTDDASDAKAAVAAAPSVTPAADEKPSPKAKRAAPKKGQAKPQQPSPEPVISDQRDTKAAEIFGRAANDAVSGAGVTPSNTFADALAELAQIALDFGGQTRAGPYVRLGLVGLAIALCVGPPLAKTFMKGKT